MTVEEARARLERMTAYDTQPLLTPEDIGDLLSHAARPDEAGLLPADVEWVPTYDLDRAARTGWEWKAGRAASLFDFSTDGQSFSREQIYEHCMAMARTYKRGFGSITLQSPYPPR